VSGSGTGSGKKVLITGISGRLGRMVAIELRERGYEVIGVDSRPWPDAPDGVTTFRADIRKRPAEDVFRTKVPDAVVHMGTVTHLQADPETRYRINLGGTRAVFDYCEKYGIKQVVFVGRHTFYGAHPDSPLYHVESDPPLAVSTFPDLADLIAADLYAETSLWRVPDMDTAVLRLCYYLGPAAFGTLAEYLRPPRIPTVMGFDPLFQFMHELDAARAIALALECRLRGVFNVAGPQPVPLSLLINVTGRVNIPVPEPVFLWIAGRFGMPPLPPGALNHIKYPTVIDDSPFRQATGFSHTFNEEQSMEAFRWA